MKISEVAQQAGVTHQAIYKRLKGKGISPESLTDKAGELTTEGLALMAELYPQSTRPSTDIGPNTQPKKLQNNLSTAAVESLRGENQRLRNELNILQTQLAEIRGERDFLRSMLEKTQETAGLMARIDALEAGQKAAQAQALIDGSSEHKRGLLSWLRRKG